MCLPSPSKYTHPVSIVTHSYIAFVPSSNNFVSIVLRSGIYCTLIAIYPRLSQATYMDSSSDTKPKNYDRIKRVLDLALQVYVAKGGKFSKGGERKKDGRNVFSHATKFPCIKQMQGSVKEAFYALHHIKGFMRDSRNEALPANLRHWATKFAEIEDADLMEDFCRI